MKRRWEWFGKQNAAHTSEVIAASLGGISAVFVCSFINYYFMGEQGALAILPSMGAVAVLLFAVPHGPMSQPWPFFVGNIVSAVVGVSAYLIFPYLPLAAALGVGGAIGAMYLTHSVHPPGGATALAAVIGGDAVHALGYGYVLFPVLINCSAMFVVALMVNNLFAWRRYPATAIGFFSEEASKEQLSDLHLEHYQAAIEECNMSLEITALQLQEINEKAEELSDLASLSKLTIELGGCYSNAAMGKNWAVRKIIDESPHTDRNKYLVIYKVLVGEGRNRTNCCTITEFSHWAKERVRPARV